MNKLMARMAAPLRRAINNLAMRATVRLVNAASKMQTLQVGLRSGETKDGIEHIEPYGFTSHPNAGAEAVTLFFNGDRSHGVAVVVGDRRFRLTGLAAGEVALHDDQGQKVHLTRNGIVVDGGGNQITITNTPKVRMETPMLEVTGEVKDLCDTTGKTMSGMRATYDSHTHPGDSGGTTSTPNQAM